MEYGVGVHIKAPVKGRSAEVVTPEAMQFVAALHRMFDPCRKELLSERIERQRHFDTNRQLGFLPETKHIRKADWTVASLPDDLRDRRVEILRGADSKSIIDALNAGANVFVADLENSTAPTWENLIEAQINLYDTIRGNITWKDEETGICHTLDREINVLAVQPRGWHMEERHVFIDDMPMSASIFDFGLYCFHHASYFLQRGTIPYFYLPKIESYLEARLWNEIFTEAQLQLGLPPGAIRATVVIETVPAIFQINEILWELRGHASGICCNREGYLFSLIKTFAKDQRFILPDREFLTMMTPLMRSYSKFCGRTGHRRGIRGVGNISAKVPMEDDSDQQITATAQLLLPPAGNITETGVQQNIALGLGYMEAWLRGIGCVSLFDPMENAATAELSLALLWQWFHHGVRLLDGREVDADFLEDAVKRELVRVKPMAGMERYRSFMRAAEMMRAIVRAENIIESLVIFGYPRLLEREHYAAV